MGDFGLYVHVPFCETKCGYCDFYSVALKDRASAPLVEALVAELERRCGSDGVSIQTVFVGGGTPTVLPVDGFGRLFSTLGAVLGRQSVVEFTVEANPATVDSEKLELLTDVGVNRLSLGAQSWIGSELETLERLHSADDVAPSVRLAREHGITRINLDLIFGIPGQTLASWNESLQRTMDLGVDHVCCYGLTYEPGTRLTALHRAGRLEACDEELESEMYLAGIDTLARAGFEQYEISNFARPGQRCLHNLIYWRNEPYIGVGPSAAGYIDGERYKNVADVGAYVRRMSTMNDAVAESERVGGAGLAGEIVMLELRLVEGVNIERFIERTGVDPRTAMAECLPRYVGQGLVAQTSDRIALTRAGRLLADSVIADCFAELHRFSEFEAGVS